MQTQRMMSARREMASNVKADKSGANSSSAEMLGSLEPAAPLSPEYTAHYPLDIPLPFHLYDHRRFTPRDLMVTRIMSDFMSPSKVTPRTYDAYISYPAEFDQIKAQHYQLGMDLKILRKTLLTSHYEDPPPPGEPKMLPTREFSCRLHRRLGLENTAPWVPIAPPTIGDQIIDLVQRYYFEADGAIVRLWLERYRPPKVPTGPRANSSGKKGSHAQAVRTFSRLVEEQQRRERKDWRPEDTEHLRGMRNNVLRDNVVSQKLLYDGGGHRALWNRILDAVDSGERRAKPSEKKLHYTLASIDTGVSFSSATAWQQGLSRTFIIQPRWRDRRDFWLYCRDTSSFCRDRTTGRGRPKTRSFVSTSILDLSGHPKRRSHSEPPPNSFCAAKLPDPHGNFLPGRLMIMFPRLPLSVIDRRSRRRSLSRSHIANMFDWDAKILPHPPGKTHPPESHKKQQELAYQGHGPSPRDAAHGFALGCDDRKEHRWHPTAQPKPQPQPEPRCGNCASKTHSSKQCLAPCGYCGAPNPSYLEPYMVPSPFRMTSKQQLPPLGNSVASPALLLSTPPQGGTIVYGPPREHRVVASNDSVVFDPLADWTRRDEWVSDVEINIAAVEGTGKHGNPHMADQCPVPRESRCKCVAFPQFHVAARCRAKCSRDCGNPRPRGSFGHRNAMTCRSRCCMCGIRGHSGKECRLKKCRCGEQHLGQDCRFKVECMVKGCDRYLCGIHCRSCGGTEKPFVEWECVTCRGGRDTARRRRVVRGHSP